MWANSPSEDSLLAKTLLNNWNITANDMEYSNFEAKKLDQDCLENKITEIC